SLFLGVAQACLNAADFAACLGVSGGALQSTAHGLSDPRSATTPIAMLGAGASYDLALSERLSLRFFAQADARLIRVTLIVDAAPAWTSPLLSGTVGVAVSAWLD